MKKIHLYLLAMATILFAACSDDDKMNTTDTTVSFGQTEYSFKESANMVQIPIKVEGERNGDIDIKLNITDGSAISEGHYIVTSDYIHVPADSEDEVFYVEIRVFDDGNAENDDRDFNISFANIEGAKAGAASSCKILLQDVDKNPYFKLFGNWTLTAQDKTNGADVTWDVTISDTDGYDNYAESHLVFTGFMEGANGYNNGAVWLVSYNKNGTLSIGNTGYFYAAYNFGSFIGAVCVAPFNLEGRPTQESVPGTYNDSFDEIVFDTSASLVGVAAHLYDPDSGDISDYKGRIALYGNIRMVKK